jgi:putative endonuclease
VQLLAWFEVHETRESAFLRERRMKKWNRAWKIARIEWFNPSWRDLYDELNG